ncbi:MAG: hypothetical protein D6681_21995 [Calditrichaeota bacterium]|nr:MAG: hypothetical protein D6681_21995 [Calditrichota bacterium]
MSKIEFPHARGADFHECDAHREGDWIVFRCPQCPDYERRLNWRTGEMEVKNNPPDINHTGSYFPHELAEAFINTN